MEVKGRTGEQVFDGLGVSPGIGIGVAHVREAGVIAVPEYKVPAKRIAEEQARLATAVNLAHRQIGQLRGRTRTMPPAAREELGYLLDAYALMLTDSRLIRGVERRVVEDHLNAEAAIQAELAVIAASFQAMDDAYIAARLDDIRGVANRLVRNLMRSPGRPLATLPKGSVVIAEELTPADTIQLDPARVVGFATLLGGAEGHTAIMARALGLPAVLGAAGLLRGARTGATVIVDGDTGRIIVDPAPPTLAEYERRQTEHQRARRGLARLRHQPAVTRDGVAITLQANVELPIQMESVAEFGALGIGLLRSEFMFMNRDDIPGEDEQYERLRDFVAGAGGHPVTIRTLDIGGEKTALTLTGDIGPSAYSPLGLRGIRLSLAQPAVFETQLRAILRVGAHGPVRILLPMVSTVAEIRRARDCLACAARALRRRKVDIPHPLPPVGVMIEVPGAALSADALAQACDFFAIGSNDLTMYTLAIDRADEQVASLYNPLHPAVLRLIQFSAEAGLRARRPVSICGEIAGDPRFTPLLLGLGIRDLSMSASRIPLVKSRIRELDIAAAASRARLIMDQIDSGRIAMLLDDFNALA